MIKVDEEFQSLIPPLTAEEYTQLEKNIIKDGIRDPLVVWPQSDGTDILIDGHNRLKISNTHHGIQCKTVPMEFADREEAKLWIISNQLGRRNLPKFDRVTLEDKKREILAKQAKENLGGDHKSAEFQKSKDKISCPLKTRQEKRENSTDFKIAKAADTSEDTVRKVRKINEKATDRTKQLVREGKLSINQAYNSVSPKKPDPVKRAKEEHKEFQEKKKEAVVSMDDVQLDKINRDIINTALLQDVRRVVDAVTKFGFMHKEEELSGLHDMLAEDERTALGLELDRCMGIIQVIGRNI